MPIPPTIVVSRIPSSPTTVTARLVLPIVLAACVVPTIIIPLPIWYQCSRTQLKHDYALSSRTWDMRGRSRVFLCSPSPGQLPPARFPRTHTSSDPHDQFLEGARSILLVHPRSLIFSLGSAPSWAGVRHQKLVHYASAGKHSARPTRRGAVVHHARRHRTSASSSGLCSYFCATSDAATHARHEQY
ncbi:hypothetical protein FB451DRAFT_1394042 [Mycena latifolia]|nr:hypothetical protein FB451DRAFT_1394042 [Mycena latifolia]